MQIQRLIAYLGLALISASPLLAQAQGKKHFGLGHPFAVEELPNGILKQRLQQLRPQARAAALKRLHTFSFPASDAAEYLKVDDNGGVFIVCPVEGCGHDCKNADHDHGDDEPAAEDADSSNADAADVPAENIPIGDGGNQTFNPTASVSVSAPPAFHSKPGAPFHIYLDFNGAYVTGKQWTYSDGTTTWSTWDCAAWSSDGDATTFSVAEQNDIRRMWERIAEDYAPFNVNVTTDVAYDPDNYTGDKNKVGWLLTTPTTDKNGVRCPHYGFGGMAYVNVFGLSDYFSRYQPAWVSPMSTANIAEAASHEMGHNMGLSHDGLSTGSPYYGGHEETGSAPSWGPIMGTGYNRNVSQWSMGEYFNGNQPQDDLAVIAGKVNFRADDHGDSHATATAWTQSPVNQAGVVENTDDPDVFTFTTGAANISFSATTFRSDTQTWGGNLDVILELYDSSLTLVANSNPLADTNATISASVPAGTYYLILKPSAAGDPLASTPSGYSLYGSLGHYSLSGTFSPTDSMFVTAPGGGEIWLRGASNEITWASGAGGNVSIELLKGGSLHSTISPSTPNDGSFLWTIPPAQPADGDYKIRITSLLNPNISNESGSTFSIVADLLAAALDTNGYSWTTSGNTAWFAQSAITSDGVDAARSGLITHNQVSSMQTTLVGPGTMTFRWKVSSESGFDSLRFFINNVEQTGSLALISGEVDWVMKTVSIPAGNQTVKWSYNKDGSVDGGADAAWVDQVVFTPVASPGSLAVTPAGGFTSTGTYGGTFTPSSQQFTLSNPGSTSINWSAAEAQSWLSLSATSGTLAAGASTTVTAMINASSQNAGFYSGSITFINTTNNAGNTNRSVSLIVSPATATITLDNLNATYDGTPKAVFVTTNPAGLAYAVSYEGEPTAPTNAGTYAVAANITAPNYTGGTPGSLVIAKASQNIDFAALNPVPDDAAPFSLTATATSGLALSYSSSNPNVATVSGNIVTVVGSGSTVITASQAGNANYHPALAVPQTLTVVRANPLAVAGGPYSLVINQSLALNGSASLASHGETIASYQWDLNQDGIFGDATGATPTAISYAELTGTWGMLQGANAIQLKVTDSAGKTSTATTTLMLLNTAPVAIAQNRSTAEDTALPITLTGSDAELNPLTFTILSPPANGTLSGTAPNLTFTPAANFHGATSFTFKVNDGAIDSPSATVSINVTPVNDAPVAVAQNVSTAEDSAKAITLAGTDVDLNTLSYVIVTPPANGSLSGTAPNVTFTPAANFNGATSFTFKVNDGTMDSAIATVSITVTVVNDVPVFLTNPIIGAAASEGVAYTGQTLAGKATDSDAGDTITYAKVSGPAWLAVAANGALSGTPPAGSSGLNSFVVRATDSASGSADATLQINVAGLPLPWISTGIGTGMLAGSATFNAGTFTQAGSGIIGGTSDKLRFTYQTLTGDGEIIARISNLQNTGSSARVGVMIRESLAANSKEIFMGMAGSDAYRWVRRTSTGGSTTVTNSSTGTVPNTWVRLVRSGTTITAYKSTNGTSWTTVGSTTKTTFASTCYIGLAVGSGSDTTLNTSQFSNVSVTP